MKREKSDKHQKFLFLTKAHIRLSNSWHIVRRLFSQKRVYVICFLCLLHWSKMSTFCYDSPTFLDSKMGYTGLLMLLMSYHDVAKGSCEVCVVIE